MPEDQKTAEQHYLDGQLRERELHPAAARAAYEKALGVDTGHADSLRSLGVLDATAGRLDAAAERLLAALQRNPADSWAWFHLGVVQLAQDRPADALECAYEAVRQHTAAARGFDLAGRAWGRLGQWDKARDCYECGIALAPGDSRIADHRLIAALRQGGAANAKQLADEAVRARTLDLVPRFVQWLADPHEASAPPPLDDWLRMTGADEFIVVEAALTCAETGAWREALATLEALAGDATLAARPIPWYLRAYFTRRADPHADIAQLLETARRCPPEYVFPSRAALLPALELAAASSSADARVRYYLGNLLAGLGRMEEAADRWRESVEIDPSLHVAHRNLAHDAWKRTGVLADAEQSFRRAIAARPDDQTHYRDLGELPASQDRHAEVVTLLQDMPRGDHLRSDVLRLLVDSHIHAHNSDAALDILAQARIAKPREGSTLPWQLFHTACLQRGRDRLAKGDAAAALEDFRAALTYPRHLGVGRPSRPEEAEAHYAAGSALEALGRREDAIESYRKAAGGQPGSDAQNTHRCLAQDALKRLAPPSDAAQPDR